jgi:hypothetical protein
MRKNLKMAFFCAEAQKIGFAEKVEIWLNKKRCKTVGYQRKLNKTTTNKIMSDKCSESKRSKPAAPLDTMRSCHR